MTTATKPWSRDDVYATLARSRHIVASARRGHRASAEAIAYAEGFLRLPERAFGHELATLVLEATAVLANAEGLPPPPEGFDG